ncbi:MAG TPA: NADPH:quinone oxidoreductase family protein [Acidimicrobiales bacterium]|jgi:NADPH2:quinone reductase|nr:NADPH:quinone oxidoreductase family protein [Acidimicrobiales bacterium]
MKAIVCTRFGGPELLEVGEVDQPVAGPGQVLVDVKACSVNFPDLLMIQDLYQFKPKPPFVPGSEVSGVVMSVGEGVDRFQVGDRVLGSSLFIGGLAEIAALSADTTVALPDDVDYADAAGLLYAYGTSHHALKDRADLQPGQSLLVLGAAGAVGLAAVEIGALMGARVIAAASSDEKLDLCRRYGATETVNYSTQDLKTVVRDLTGGDGADVVYDPVGGPYSEPALRATAWDGKFLVVGFAAGDIPKIPLNLALLRGCSIVGVFWGSFVMREPERHRANVTEMVGWWSEGRLRPHTSASYPLDQAAQAFRDMAERRAMGKVVVTL